MSLKDFKAPLDIPSQWKAQSTWNGREGAITTGPIQPVEDFKDLLKNFGYDPKKVEIVGSVNQWRKEQADGEWLISYFFKVQSREGRVDLPTLYAESRKAKKLVKTPARTGVTSVVVLADAQIGKVDHRGGTPELLERLKEKRDALEAIIRKERPENLVLLEGGDLFEGFNSGGNPMFTNDLSLSEQLDMAATEVFKFVEMMQRYAPVSVGAVTSNHTAWRNGKQRLGNPGDDLAFHVHRSVEKLCQAHGYDATWFYPPSDFDETLLMDVRGTGLGLVHGDQCGSPDRFPAWLAKQTLGGSPLAGADVVVSGHFHHLRIQPVGRNAHRGNQKWWIQAPTMDGGSTWYRNAGGGYDSDAGIVTFDITDQGFSVNSVRML